MLLCWGLRDGGGKFCLNSDLSEYKKMELDCSAPIDLWAYMYLPCLRRTGKTTVHDAQCYL